MLAFLNGGAGHIRYMARLLVEIVRPDGYDDADGDAGVVVVYPKAFELVGAAAVRVFVVGGAGDANGVLRALGAAGEFGDAPGRRSVLAVVHDNVTVIYATDGVRTDFDNHARNVGLSLATAIVCVNSMTARRTSEVESLKRLVSGLWGPKLCVVDAHLGRLPDAAAAAVLAMYVDTKWWHAELCRSVGAAVESALLSLTPPPTVDVREYLASLMIWAYGCRGGGRGGSQIDIRIYSDPIAV